MEKIGYFRHEISFFIFHFEVVGKYEQKLIGGGHAFVIPANELEIYYRRLFCYQNVQNASIDKYI